jgi:tetratricopeptide (TPR) repeat protein
LPSRSVQALGPVTLIALSLFAAACGRERGIAEEPRLASVPEADLSSAEPAVREQLVTERQRLEAVLAGPDGSPAERASAYGRLGQLHHAYDLLEAAEICYGNARLLAPDSPRWSYLHGLVLERRGEIEAARAAFEETLRLSPGNVPALLHLGRVELADNRLEQARDRFAAALAADSSCQAARFGLGETARRLEDFERAAEHFGRVLAEQPEALQVHYPLSQVLLRLGRRAEAQRHLDAAGGRARSVGGRPQCHDPLDLVLAEIRTGSAAALRRGLLLGLAGDPDEELRLLTRAVGSSPSDAVARQRLGNLLLQRGELEAAREQLTEAARLSARNPEILVSLGVASARLGRYEEAEESFRAALEINPGSAHYQMQLGLALQQQTRCLEAVELFDAVLTLEPAHRQALLQSASCLARLGRTEEAGRRMARLLDAHPPDDPGERLRMASMLLSLGEHAIARRHFSIVADSDAPAEVRAQAHLLIGRVEMEEGDRAAAAASLDRALALDPALAAAPPGQPPG